MTKNNRNNIDLILALSGGSGGGGGGSEANANIANSFSTGTDYTAGDYVIYGGNLYKFVQDKAAGAWDSSVVESATVGADLSKKLNLDGYSALATVGNAEQLVSTVRVTDQVPYIFRASGGSADIGNREYDTVVGGSLPWNQLVQNGNFANGTTGWTAARLTPTVQSNVAHLVVSDTGDVYFDQQFMGEKDHVYVAFADLKTDASNTGTFGLRVYYEGTAQFKSAFPTTSWSILSIMVKDTVGGINDRVRIFGNNNAVNDAVDVTNVHVHDITQMFGSAVADHIYALEQANAGDGVAWFRVLFPKPYYAYNAGELLSVSGLQSHDMTGFNQYNHAVGTAELLGGHEYQITGAYTSLSYSTGESIAPDSNGVFTPSENGTLTVTGGDNSTTCVHLIWSGYRNGEYEPYQLNSYPLDSSLTLRGIPKLDEDDNLYYDGDIYAADGTVTRRYGIVDLGTLTWEYEQTNALLFANFPACKVSTKGLICERFYEPYTYYSGLTGATSGIHMDSNANLYIKDPNYTDATTFKTAMSGVYLVYELATPTTETADPFQSPQIVDDFGTERYVVAEQGGVAVPVGHRTEYPANLRDKLQHLPSLAEADGFYGIQQTGTLMTLAQQSTDSFFAMLDRIGNPILHRQIYRGQFLGTSLTAEQKAAIAAGTFTGIWLGDYWTINSVDYVVADFDYWYRVGDTDFNKHHIVVIPSASMYTAEMNDTNTTAGGYYGSKMRGVEVDGVFTPYAQGCGLYNALTAFQAAFGDALLTHREYLCNAVTDGKESAGAWFASIVDLPSEIMIYGTSIRTASPQLSTIGKSQMALMAASPKFINTRETYWLRDVVSATNFASVNYSGGASHDTALNSCGVRPVAAIGG